MTKADGSTISPTDLDERFLVPSVIETAVSFQELQSRHDQETRIFLLSAIESSRSVGQAAEKIGLPATTLRSMVGRYGLKQESERMA